MKILKVADLEALLGDEATQRVVAAITAKKAKPKKPLPEYIVLVSETHEALVRVTATSGREARRLVMDREVIYDERPTVVRTKIVKPEPPVVEAKVEPPRPTKRSVSPRPSRA